MARLRRLYYDTIGHPEARFMDLEIPLTGEDGAPTETVVWLMNGGGKSALLSLVFNVIRPALKEFLGQKVDDKIRTLGDYVLKDDHGVVVLEWELDDGNRTTAASRLITGAFFERKPGTAKVRATGDDEGVVDRLYFSYYVRDGVPSTTLEKIPLFTDASKKARFASAGFKARMDEIAGEAPHAQVFTTTNQGDWADLLESRGIDPDLFLYQIRMNQREGGAMELFRNCTTVASYVDLFLEVLIDRTFGENIRQNLAAQRTGLANRKFKFVPGRALTESLLAGLAPLHAVAVTRTALAHRGAALAARYHALQQYAEQRLALLAATMASLTHLAADAQADADAHHATAATARRQAATWQRDVALVNLRDARAEQKRITERNTELQRLSAGWTAALPLREALRHESAAREARSQLAERERKHAPLLERLTSAANLYLGALRAHAAGLEEKFASVVDLIASYEATAGEAQRMASTALQDEARAGAAARAFDEKDTILRADLRHLVDTGVLLRADEPVVEAGLRLADAGRVADGQVREADRVVALATTAREHAARDVDLADQQRQEADQQLRADRQTLHLAEERAAKIARLPRLAEVLELPIVDATLLHEDTVVVLRTQARHAFEQALLARATVAAGRRAADALRDTGLLPASVDVTRVLTALVTAVPQAHAGWRYLADAMTPSEAIAVVDRAPDIALGVVVRDADYETAIRTLRLAPPTLDEPVRLTRQSDVATGATGGGFVVRAATDAHFNRAAGQTALVTLERQLATADADGLAADATYQTLTTTASALQGFLDDYGAAWFVDHRAVVARASVALEAAVVAMERATALLTTATTAERTAQADRSAALARHQGLLHLASALADSRRRHGDDADVHRKAAHVARLAATEANERAVAFTAQVAEARAEADAARGMQLSVAQERAVLTREMGEISWAEEPVAPLAGNRHELAQSYQRAKDIYEAKIDSRGLITLAERDEQEARKKREELGKRLGSQRQGWTVESVGELLATLEDPSEAEGTLSALETEKGALFSQNGNHSKVVQAAEGVLKTVRETCLSLRLTVTVADDATRLTELPDDPAHTERTSWAAQATAADAAARTADADAVTAEEMRADAERQMQDARLAEANLTNGVNLLRAAQDQQAEFLARFPVTAAVIATQLPVTDEAFRAAIQPWSADRSRVLAEWSTLDADRDEAARAINRLLTHPEYAHLIDANLVRMRDALPHLLEAHVDELTTDLTDRLAVLIEAIADVDRHRDQLITFTHLAGEQGRRLLRQMAGRSMLPMTVPHFGGNPVVKMSGLEGGDAAAERAAAEALIESLTTRDDKFAPTALELVQQAVHAIAPKLAIEVIFPKIARGLQYKKIVELGRMSGGEGLTVAMLLYCTLARVRAISHGKTGTASGVLLFDNPFGTASAATFVTMQREMARALNVQLIYFTGVLDLEAVRLLPNRVRLGADRLDRAVGHLLVERKMADDALDALQLHEAPASSLGALQLTVGDAPYLYDGVSAFDPEAGTSRHGADHGNGHGPDNGTGAGTNGTGEGDATRVAGTRPRPNHGRRPRGPLT